MSWSALLTDIEGTTTPLSFVRTELHPLSYSVAFLESIPQDNIFAELIEAFKRSAPAESPDISSLQTLSESIQWHLQREIQTAPLKEIQGYIWKFAFEKGSVKGMLFEDVAPAFQKLCEKRIPIFIYSSGSVAAQKLLFAHSINGDVSHLLAGHFDTTIGTKTHKDSYKRIAEQTKCDPFEMLFVSDNPRELAAASAAGMQVRLAVRPGNLPLSESDQASFKCIETFEEIF